MLRICEPADYASLIRPTQSCFYDTFAGAGSRLADIWRKPRLWVGLIRISLMQTRGGMLATKAMVRPRSSDCSILACSSADGTCGRSFRIGGATSPGDRQQARRPLAHSSMLKEWVSASTACLVVV